MNKRQAGVIAAATTLIVAAGVYSVTNITARAASSTDPLTAAKSHLSAAIADLSQVPATVTTTAITTTTVMTTATVTATVTATPSPTPTPTPTPSPTPTPTPSPSVSTLALNCFPQPSACGYPDGTNTGVIPGTTLTPSGSVTVTTDGTLVQNLVITGELDIYANNVTVNNVKIIATGGYHALYVTGTGVLIENVEIDGRHLNPSVPGLVGGGYTALNLNIHGTGDGIDVWDNATIKNSYIHDLTANSGDHSDGIQSTGSSNVLVQHNTFDATAVGANSAAIIGADQSNMSNVTLKDNIFAGGNYEVYAGTGGYTVTNVTFDSNRFTRTYQYGPCSVNNSKGVVVFTGNYWDDTDQSLSCG